MTDYCTGAQLADLLPTVTFGEATTPTDLQIDGYIGHASAEIDGVLRVRGVSLPVTDAETLLYLRTICLYGVASMALAAKFGSGTEAASGWETRYREALKAIRDGAVAIDELSAAAHFSEGFTADAEGRPRLPFVTRRTEW